MTTDTRFSGTIGDEYNMFSMVIPHHNELQKTLADTVRDYARAHSNLKTISVVEIGCGTGITTRNILEVDPRIQVIAIDIEEKMIERARTALADFDSRVTFVCGDALNKCAPIPEESHDLVMSAYTLHNLGLEYRAEILAEISRILKPTGIYANADKYARNDLGLHAQDLISQLKVFSVFDTIGRPDLRDEWTRHYLEDDDIRITEEAEKSLLEKYNFVDIQITWRKHMEAIFVATKK